jgi:hypothetical protein
MKILYMGVCLLLVDLMKQKLRPVADLLLQDFPERHPASSSAMRGKGP